MAAVRAMIESGRFEGRTLRYLESIPGRDRDRLAYDLLADLIPEENFMSFVQLWHEGFPGLPLQTWITTRYHFHQLAAAVGAEGIAIEIDDSYYRTKHQSLAAARHRVRDRAGRVRQAPRPREQPGVPAQGRPAAPGQAGRGRGALPAPEAADAGPAARGTRRRTAVALEGCLRPPLTGWDAP